MNSNVGIGIFGLVGKICIFFFACLWLGVRIKRKYKRFRGRNCF